MCRSHFRGNFLIDGELPFSVRFCILIIEVNCMRELIGDCQSCGKNVYCEDGFFDGVQAEGLLHCNECAEKKETDKHD